MEQVPNIGRQFCIICCDAPRTFIFVVPLIGMGANYTCKCICPSTPLHLLAESDVCKNWELRDKWHPTISWSASGTLSDLQQFLTLRILRTTQTSFILTPLSVFYRPTTKIDSEIVRPLWIEGQSISHRKLPGLDSDGSTTWTCAQQREKHTKRNSFSGNKTLQITSPQATREGGAVTCEI